MHRGSLLSDTLGPAGTRQAAKHVPRLQLHSPQEQRKALHVQGEGAARAFTSSMLCLKGQSGSLHSPNLSSVRQTGMRAGSYWCRNPQSSPFMHRFFSQYVHTVCAQTQEHLL